MADFGRPLQEPSLTLVRPHLNSRIYLNENQAS